MCFGIYCRDDFSACFFSGTYYLVCTDFSCDIILDVITLFTSAIRFIGLLFWPGFFWLWNFLGVCVDLRFWWHSCMACRIDHDFICGGLSIIFCLDGLFLTKI